MDFEVLNRLAACTDLILQLTREKTSPGKVALRDACCSFLDLTARLRRNLELSLLENAAADALRRFHSYHFMRINDLARQLESATDGMQAAAGLPVACLGELCRLNQHLLVFFDVPVKPGLVAFPTFARDFVQRLEGAVSSVAAGLTGPEATFEPAVMVQAFFDQLQRAGLSHQYSYQSLFYGRYLAEQLEKGLSLPAGDRRNFLVEQLIRCNFNHLGFLTFVQEKIRSDLAVLPLAGRREKLCSLILQYAGCGEPATALAYDSHWPGLRVMLGGWLREELAHLTAVEQVPLPFGVKGAASRLFLDTSVAHLACFLRAFHDEGMVNIPLSELFKFVSAHFRTRRQPAISAGSLSKEFYSISQFTAARVRDRLAKMAARLGADYFPVWAVMIPVSHFLLKNGLTLLASGS